MKRTLLFIILFLLFCTFAFATETSWEGTYQWLNPTNKNNDGKCTEITFQVKVVQPKGFEVFEVMGDSTVRKLFPVEDLPADGYSWHKWDEASTVAENYRANAVKFNTTSYTPSKWRVKETVQEELYGSCKVETKAFIFTINTVSSFELRYNAETGIQELAYRTEGDSLAKMGLFFNPEPGPEGKEVFILTKID